MEAAGTEMSWEELTWASIPQPPSAIGSRLPPKGPAWARPFSVAKHVLKRLQPALPAAGQQVTPGRGVSVFIMVVSWRRHYVQALQIESKGSVSVFKMLGSCGSDARTKGPGMEGWSSCCSVAPGTCLVLPSLITPLGAARKCMPAPSLLTRKAGL